MRLLSLTDFTLSIQGHYLFHIEQLNIETGDKIGLVGANASGKSTFLKCVLEREGYAESRTFVRRGMWSYFEQKSAMIPDVEDLEQVSRWGLQDLAWRHDEKFSGGEEVRLRLANVFSEPHDMLVLDEPSAHLDEKGLQELKRQLSQESTFILVTHDRHLLNEFCHRTLVIQDGKLLDFPGTYDEWKAWDEQRQLTEMQEYDQAMLEKRRLTSVMEDQKRRAAKTQKKPKNMSYSEAKVRERWAVGKSFEGKQKSLMAAAKHTEKRIERLGELEKPKSLPKIRPDFTITDPPQNRIIVEINDLSFAYPDQALLLSNLTFALKRNTRTAIVGANGSGKTTLLHLIRRGHPQIRVVPKAKFGYFDQRFQNIDMDKTILQNIHESSVQKESVNRSVLARMGFPAQVLSKKAGVLSGGELTKLSFAKLFVSDFNVLLIDEPSNYLDIPSYEAIESLLLDFEGSMFFCSHDQYFLYAIAEEIWELKDGQLHLK